MKNELETLDKAGSWGIISLPEGHMLKTTAWNFTIKSDGRLKTRVCIRRFTQ
jgi:hypothetical protein